MAQAQITVEMKLPTRLLDSIEAIARLAGVSPATVIKVALAREALAAQGRQDAPAA